MIKLVIFGSGDHAKVIFSEIIKQKNKYEFIGFVDDFKKKGDFVINYMGKKYCVIWNINNTIKRKNDFNGIIANGLNDKREKIFKEIISINKKFNFETVISKNSFINLKVVIGNGTFIASDVLINFNSRIGNHCIINSSCSIDHDNFFKDFSSVGPGVITGGNVKLGKNSFIGIGSVVKNKINIMNNTIVGAMSLVNKNCDKNSIYFDVPAKKIKEKKSSLRYL